MKEALDYLESCGVTVVGNSEVHSKFSSIQLPFLPKSEYFFMIYFYPNNEYEIVAKTCGYPEYSFWHKSFEYSEYVLKKEVKVNFYKTLKLLLENPSRIIQKKGLFFWSFYCDIYQEGKWIRLADCSILKRGFKVPLIDRKEKTYNAFPLIRGK